MKTREMQEYAWEWFEYHAVQRLVAFRYFLIFFGVLLLALSDSIKNGNTILVSAIAMAAAFISLAFLMLEVRNEQLVNVGRNALNKIEDSEDFRNAPTELKLFHTDGKRSLIFSHKFWLRLIYGICIIVFIFLAFEPSTVMPPPLLKSA
jgi:uncharacterized membrane protein